MVSVFLECNMSKRKKNILVIGGSGFVGSYFFRHLALSKKFNYQSIAPSHSELDILNLPSLNSVMAQYRPNVVINFAAHRNANTAEEQRGDRNGSVWKTNVLGASNISKTCQKYESYLVHISTDMVFSGNEKTPGPYSEDAKVEADMKNLSWYGWTKAESEHMIKNHSQSAIIRIGNVTLPIYDPKLDYVGKILSLYDRGQLYGLFCDQHLTLTPLSLLFDVIEKLIANPSYGVFHVATSNTFTPYELGDYLIRRARGKTNQLRKVRINDFLKERPNRYPKYGGLFAQKSAHRLQVKLPDWMDVVDQSVLYFAKE